MWGNPTLFHWAKSIEKISRKDNIEIINWEIVCSSDKMIPIHFSVSVKFGACYITGQWGEFLKNVTYAFVYFFGILLLLLFFIIKFSISIIFISFFCDEISNFRHRILTNEKHELLASNCQRNCIEKFFDSFLIADEK